jgi:glycosyltransferase involved in cell wall biosynthesis
MKILIFNTVYLPSTIYGGPTSVASQHAKELVNRGHEVLIVTSNILNLKPLEYVGGENVNSTSVIDGVKIIYFKTKMVGRKFSLFSSKELIAWAKEHIDRFDVIHFHFARELMAYGLLKIAINKKKPVFLQTHGMLNNNKFPRNIIDKMTTMNILNNVNGVFVLQEVEEKVIKKINSKSYTITLPNGLNEVNNIARWNHENLDKKVILFVARLHPRKRVLDFIEMARILNRVDNNITFKIIGPDAGDLERAIKRVNEYNLQEKVTFEGAIDRSLIYKEFANSSIYVLPSINEPFAMTLLEALQVGIPTIATEYIHNKSILQNSNSIIIAKQNPESLAESVLNLLKNVEIAKNLSENGRNLILNELNINKIIDTLIYSYEKSK